MHYKDRRRWQKSAPSLIKCNVDATFFEGNHTKEMGAVLHDHEGRTCGGSNKWYDHFRNALAIEPLACRNGVQVALDHGVTRLLMETDC